MSNLINKYTPHIAIGILLFALLLLPTFGGTWFNGTIKCLGIAQLAFIFGLGQFSYQKHFIGINTTDVCWLGLITLTGASAFWAINDLYALYGFFTIILLYLSYKIFESVQWTKRTEKWLIYTFTGLILMAFVYQSYILRGNFETPIVLRDEAFASGLGDVNHHWLGSLILVLLPFLLFRKEKTVKIIGSIFLLIACFLTYMSGSAQVMLGLIALTLAFFIYLAKFSTKQVLLGLLGITLVIGIGLAWIYYDRGRLRGVFFVIDEFYDQKDRFWMWASSLQLFAEAPLTGWGKNNWELAVGNWGYNDCGYCARDEFIILRFKHAHNAFFQILAELGIIGILGYIGIGLLPIIGILRQKIKLANLQLAALISLSLFVFLSLMYGIVYNYYDHFQGLPVLAVFCLALISQQANNKSLFTLNNKLFAILFVLLAGSSFFFFNKNRQGFNQFQSANQDRITGYNLGQAELKYTAAATYWQSSKAYEQFGQLYQNLGYPKLQLAAYQKAVEKDPNNLLLQYDYGNICLAQGNYESALIAAEKVYQGAEKFLANQLLLIQAYAKTGQNKKALEMGKALKERLDRSVNNENWRAGSLKIDTNTLKKELETPKLEKVIAKAMIIQDSLKTKKENNNNNNNNTKWSVIAKNKQDKKVIILEQLTKTLAEIKDTTHREIVLNPPITPSFLTLSELPNIPKVPNHSLFFIDAVNGQMPSNNLPLSLELSADLGIRGWAVDNYAEESAGGVFIELAGELYRANYRQERQDVATAHGIPAYTKSGFSCSIPANKIAKGTHQLKIWVLAYDGTTLFTPEPSKNLILEIISN